MPQPHGRLLPFRGAIRVRNRHVTPALRAVLTKVVRPGAIDGYSTTYAQYLVPSPPHVDWHLNQVHSLTQLLKMCVPPRLGHVVIEQQPEAFVEIER